MASRPSRSMEQFSSQNSASAKLIDHAGSVHLAIERPTTLAAFFAFCSGQSSNTRVFLRGCTENYNTAYPALFRGLSDNNLMANRMSLWYAYKYVLAHVTELDGHRWRRADLGAVLQHYGIKTPWLDVVRNLYSAIWFAKHELHGTGLEGVVNPTPKDYFWLSFYRRYLPATGTIRRVQDISAHHSSTHLRPHVQHGGSLAMQRDDAQEPDVSQDFNRFRIAQIRIPNTTEWDLSGYMASTAFMFPSATSDGSLRALSTPRVREILEDACTQFRIPAGSLGQVSSYR